MDAPISAAPDEKSLPVVEAMEAELSNLVKQESSLKPSPSDRE